MKGSLISDLYQPLDETQNSSDNSGDYSPSATTATTITTFATSISSPKTSRRAIQKRSVTIPVKDVEGRFKGDCSTPPSDSWAWRKYGQKPIKGSPYPRGYYKCSSSKGCPARKQVERSHSDPDMLVITYSYDHNHPWPATSRNHRHQNRLSTTASTTVTATSVPAISIINPPTTNNTIDEYTYPKIDNHDDGNQTLFQPRSDNGELTWFSSENQMFDDNPFLFTNSNFGDFADVAKMFPVREEEESFFADLGELPDFSVVFQQAAAVEEQRQCSLTPWYGTIG